MLCYKCHNQMKKYVINNTVIDQCNICGSIWLDEKQFYHILYNTSKETLNQIKEKIKNQNYQQNKYVILKMCPRCQVTTLDTINVHNISIDKCSNCKGIFFDYKQFDKMLNYYKNKNFLIRLLNKISFKLFN